MKNPLLHSMMLSLSWLATSSALLRHLKPAAAEDSRRSEGGLDSPARESLEECFPNLDKSWFSSLAKSPRGFLRKALREAQKRGKGQSYCRAGSIGLPPSHLYECSCKGSGPHNRFSFFSMRAKMEDLIVDHVARKLGSTVRILSFGSGGCLQELVLAARLAKAGVRSVRLALVEPDRVHADACRDLVYFLGKMGEAYDMRISCGYFECVADIGTEERFDVVYAIDCDGYRPCLDYSGRKLAHGEGSFGGEGRPASCGGNPYLVATGLIRAANLAIGAENALVVVSRGRDIISLTPETCRSRLAELKNLSLSGISYRPVDFFYLNADISNLLISLEHFIGAGKPLLINRAILLAEDVESVGTFLDHRRIACEFVDDAAVPGRLERARGLVVDCTRFDWRRGETAVMYTGSSISVARIDWARSRRGGAGIRIYGSLARFGLGTGLGG